MIDHWLGLAGSAKRFASLALVRCANHVFPIEFLIAYLVGMLNKRCRRSPTVTTMTTVPESACGCLRCLSAGRYLSSGACALSIGSIRSERPTHFQGFSVTDRFVWFARQPLSNSSTAPTVETCPVSQQCVRQKRPESASRTPALFKWNLELCNRRPSSGEAKRALAGV